MKTVALIVALAAATPVFAAGRAAPNNPFYVYQDAASRENHYCPSGWMGDFSDLHMNQRWDKNPASGKYSTQIKYTAERHQGAGWAGIYWQDPCNNWGDKKGGFDLTGFTKLKFKARGEKGGEIVEKFQMGGITGQGESGDSDNIDSGAITLTKEWKEYTLDLNKLDLSDIVGGFCLVFSAESDPNGATVYLDDVRFEK